MKRRTLKLGMFLLAGAIINTAVAWGCARFSSLGDYDVMARFRPEELQWVSKVRLKLDPGEILIYRYKSIGRTLRQYAWRHPFADSLTVGIGIELYAGFPFNCLRGEIVPTISDRTGLYLEAINGRAAHRSKWLMQFGAPVVGWTDVPYEVHCRCNHCGPASRSTRSSTL